MESAKFKSSFILLDAFVNYDSKYPECFTNTSLAQPQRREHRAASTRRDLTPYIFNTRIKTFDKNEHQTTSVLVFDPREVGSVWMLLGAAVSRTAAKRSRRCRSGRASENRAPHRRAPAGQRATRPDPPCETSTAPAHEPSTPMRESDA